MQKAFAAHHLDVEAFARAGAELEGHSTLGAHARLMAETGGNGADVPLNWAASGELRSADGRPDEIWLHLEAETTLPMTCQRCLTPMDVNVTVERAFRFVNDEDTAAALDEESEDDVLALSRDFDLVELVDDELLMEMPLVPRHDVCPVDVKLAVADEEFDAALADKPNPFAALAKLRNDKSS